MPRMFFEASHRPALILLFAKKFSRSVATALCRRAVKRPDTTSGLQPNEVDRTNILAPGFVPALARNHLPPAFTPEDSRGLAQLGSRIQLQQRNCSRFSRDFLRRSTFSSSQRTELRSSGLRSALQELFNQPRNNRFLCHQLALLLTLLSPAAPVSSGRISRWLCRKDSRTRGLR